MGFNNYSYWSNGTVVIKKVNKGGRNGNEGSHRISDGSGNGGRLQISNTSLSPHPNLSRSSASWNPPPELNFTDLPHLPLRFRSEQAVPLDFDFARPTAAPPGTGSFRKRVGSVISIIWCHSIYF